MTMTPKEEEAYLAGGNSAWRTILAEALRHLHGGDDWTKERLVLERSAAIASLRTLCRKLGDDEWPDNLHLVDIIEKHVVPHIIDILEKHYNSL